MAALPRYVSALKKIAEIKSVVTCSKILNGHTESCSSRRMLDVDDFGGFIKPVYWERSLRLSRKLLFRHLMLSRKTLACVKIKTHDGQ